MITIGFLHTADAHVETFTHLLAAAEPTAVGRHLVDAAYVDAIARHIDEVAVDVDVDVVVLAQASMAAAAARCHTRRPVLTSPKLAIDAVLAVCS